MADDGGEFKRAPIVAREEPGAGSGASRLTVLTKAEQQPAVPRATLASAGTETKGASVGRNHLLLVTGCARSASGYMAAVLQACGLDVGHEIMGMDGCVSWTMAVPATETPWGPARNGTVKFEHIFHQVRHPLSVISSVWTTEGPRSWGFIPAHVPKIREKDSIEVRCAKYWYYWNRIAGRLAEWTYRVEDLPDAWPELCRRLGRKLDPHPLATVSKTINARCLKPPSRGTNVLERDFTWADLRKMLRPRLFANVCKLAQRYGYSIADEAPTPRMPAPAPTPRMPAPAPTPRMPAPAPTPRMPAPASVPKSIETKSGVRVALQKRLLLVTGCARSGTAYTALVLKACGLAMEHESIGTDGCVSWLMAVLAAEVPWGAARDGTVAFEHIFHQVRHPLAVISSAWSTEGPPSWEFICRHMPRIKATDSVEVRCAKYWIYWNRAAERQAEWTYRVEDLEAAWPELCRRLGKELDPRHLKTVSTSANSRITKPQSRGVKALERDFTWDNLRCILKPRLFAKLCRSARHYGYTVPDSDTLVVTTVTTAARPGFTLLRPVAPP